MILVFWTPLSHTLIVFLTSLVLFLPLYCFFLSKNKIEEEKCFKNYDKIIVQVSLFIGEGGSCANAHS